MRIKLFGNGYMKLSVTSGSIFEDDHAPASSAPTMHTFANILRDREKKRQEAAERAAERVRNAPPSSKEPWFETNHPMRSWLNHGGTIHRN
jgi:hypothetical protein